MRKSKQILILAALLFSFLSFPADKVFAAFSAAEVPLTVGQSFEQKSNESEIDLTGNYELHALDADTPMPEDSQNGIYSFELKGTKAEKTISLQFLHGGVYRYQLMQTTRDQENYTYDRSCYNITVYMKNSEDGTYIPQVIAEKEDGKKYGKLEFQNFYNKERPNPSTPGSSTPGSSAPGPSEPKTPVKTGDSTNTAKYIMIALGALALIVLLGYKKRGRDQINNRG